MMTCNVPSHELGLCLVIVHHSQISLCDHCIYFSTANRILRCHVK